MIVGVTGGIASGKSVVASFFQELGAYLIDWDVLAREVVCPHHQAWEGIVAYFGTEVLNSDMSLNRAVLGEKVFGHPEKLQKLNEIVHPEIIKEDARITAEVIQRDPQAIIIKDIPLLGERSARTLVDKVVLVCVSEETQMKRLAGRGLSPQKARERISSQLPIEEKRKFAHFIINNDGSLEETKKAVERIYNILQR